MPSPLRRRANETVGSDTFRTREVSSPERTAGLILACPQGLWKPLYPQRVPPRPRRDRISTTLCGMHSPQHTRLAGAVWCALALYFCLSPPQLAFAAASISLPTPAITTAAPRPQEMPAARWEWPVPQPARVTRTFNLPHRYAAGHRGIDLAAEPASTVTAVADGTVRFGGRVVDRPVLSIQHSDGLISTYEPVTSDLRRGQQVTAGQPIGKVAMHPIHQPDGGLHLGARIGDDYLDPLTLLDRPPRAVLLPLHD